MPPPDSPRGAETQVKEKSGWRSKAEVYRNVPGSTSLRGEPEQTTSFQGLEAPRKETGGVIPP